mmetsp:Transcript_33944/g.72373  ORF Transcript_33944/g.72373 Transcript_33944/m.72373 type:complete len:107 (+) Transcript_33944:81-401(+)
MEMAGPGAAAHGIIEVQPRNVAPVQHPAGRSEGRGEENRLPSQLSWPSLTVIDMDSNGRKKIVANRTGHCCGALHLEKESHQQKKSLAATATPTPPQSRRSKNQQE